MRPMSALLLVALAVISPLSAADQPGANPPPAPGADDAQRGGRGPDRMLQRLIAEHPELKDVDPKTPAGQEKIHAVMGEQMRKRMSEQQAANHEKLKTSFAMTAEEFTAVEPLLTRVETLRRQKLLIDPAGAGMGWMRGGPGGDANGRGRGMFNPQNMLAGIELDPAVKEVQDATKALKTLVEDAQANAAELASAVTRVRKAREAFQTVLGKAQEELRGVLSPRQEAILIDQGALE